MDRHVTDFLGALKRVADVRPPGTLYCSCFGGSVEIEFEDRTELAETPETVLDFTVAVAVFKPIAVNDHKWGRSLLEEFVPEQVESTRPRDGRAMPTAEIRTKLRSGYSHNRTFEYDLAIGIRYRNN